MAPGNIGARNAEKDFEYYINTKSIPMKTNTIQRLRNTALSLLAIGALFAAPVASAQGFADDDGPSPVAVPEGGSLAPIFAVTVAGVCIAAWRFKKK